MLKLKMVKAEMAGREIDRGNEKVIRSFYPGMIIEAFFLLPAGSHQKPMIRLCVVMAVHIKGILVHPFMVKKSSGEECAVYTRFGRVACDLRNIIESPHSYAVAQTMKQGEPNYQKGRLDDQDFALVREMSLDCAYNGLTKSERVRGDASMALYLRKRFGIQALQQPSSTELGQHWKPRTL